MKLKKNIPLFFIVVVLASCGGNDKKSPPPNSIDTLNYHEDAMASDSTDTLSVVDSLLLTMQNAPVYVDDTAALNLKARLAADTSGKINDDVKNEIREAREYMRKKRGN